MNDFLELLKYAFLGLVQGITEPIPVSSSAHVIIVQKLFGLEIEGLGFEVLVNFASLLAILLIYKNDLIQLIKHGYLYLKTKEEQYKKDFHFILYLIIATIPAGLIGFLFNDLISDVFKGMLTIAISLLVTGIALWLIRNLRGRKNEAGLKLKDAIIIGLAQTVALIPGISRSGATIVAGMGLGLKQSTALKFSFFLYIPVSVGSMILEGSNLIHDPLIGTLALPYTLAFLCSLVTSYFSMKWFMGIMERGQLKYFSWYCFLLSAFILIFML
ncbi:undecaprenyl-diphosphate phosphatase [Paenibacillus macquariensis]|uniref:Undecaprenyl-diphosphatase n=1 Tax=Paenibacillus macquariensis TaxID=948756 RepID=A0ABY1K8U3_9BACL|nr:undecaprenyl-diphosphate phosphatase [Paenibacillus macquariensis]MEC0093336.1 undecaprenyl-diphosphate phosphatase [Paenibacillus macquariensis]OAB27508.1 UDP pyrophosphate phosphatase [Paenibacillus macquariensis subsp. macquariensis]SIR42134.1 Undecaprenyl-diphosphatase [Paenibacillus macquariensis]